MSVKAMMIIRDVLYAIVVILLLLPGDLNPFPGIAANYKVGLAAVAVGIRIWQHVNYYKATGKIY